MKRIKSFLDKCEAEYHKNHPDDIHTRREIIWSRLKKIYPIEIKNGKAFLGALEIYAPLAQTHNHFYICSNGNSLLIQSPENLGYWLYNTPKIKKLILGEC